MWIFCAGMKRSGSTLQYQIASHLVEGVGRGFRLPWSPSHEFPEVRERHADSHAWLLFKSHECTPEMAAEFLDHDARGLYTFRDLRDVIASQMVFLGTSFERLWSTGFLNECVEQHAAWTTQPRMFVTRYEATIDDPLGHVQQIAEHLEIRVKKSQVAEIAADYSFENQQARIANTQHTSWRHVPAVDKELRFDPRTLLHHNHLGSGRPGAWAEILSADERLRVEDAFGGWLLDHGYTVN
jgi:Sulfotransferase domain